MALCDLVIQEAEKWIGYLEKKSNSQLESLTANAGYNNYTIFCKWYEDWFYERGFQPSAWCAEFVSCMIYKGCNNKEVIKHFAYCPYGVNYFKQNGWWHTSNPKRGDVIFFKDSSGTACHTGLVSSASSSIVVTIEGNTSSSAGVVANGGCVAKKSYAINNNRIMGYGRPPYENYETSSKPEETKPQKETFTASVEKKIMEIDGKQYQMSSIMKDGENYIRMRDLEQAGYTVGWDEGTQIPSLYAPQTRAVDKQDEEDFELSIQAVKDRFGFEDQTMQYLFRYQYGVELLEKLIESD